MSTNWHRAPIYPGPGIIPERVTGPEPDLPTCDDTGECVFSDTPGDVDICTGCGDHTRYCECCAESECCGSRMPVLD
jgi:hypothetical protein